MQPVEPTQAEAGPSNLQNTNSRPPSPALSDVSNSGSQRGFGGSPVHAAALTEYLQHRTQSGQAKYGQGSFLVSFLPSHVEYAEKEAKRQRLETLARSVLPGARLLPFGSTANGLSLRNSDMDLCCLLAPQADGLARKAPAELVERLGQAIEKESDVTVKMLPRARIPIIKLTFPPSPSLPFGLACDIGFENELALRNTRLLLTYAIVDSRLRTMVLFVKVWTKRRRINNPYIGTLSSYGYVLMVIHFLINVAQPPVLPNLQQIPPLQPIPPESIEFDGYNTYFFDDIELLPHIWPSNNNDNVGDLLIAFFHYFAKQFDYASHVVSIRHYGGVVSKLEKGWVVNREMESEFYGGPRELNRLCIEDPFQIKYNVARTVTRDGLYTIRQEINRALKMLSGATDRISAVVNELCEEREDVLMQVPPGASASGSRRKSAPSQRPQPTLQTQPMPDFRALYAKASPNGQSMPQDFYHRNSNQNYASHYNTFPGNNQFERQNDYGHYQPRQNQYTRNYRRNQYGYQSLPRRNQPYSGSIPGSPPQAPQLERRSSWDGMSTVNARTTPPVTQYYATEPPNNRSSMTAPTSPVVGPARIPLGPNIVQHPRSQSHSSGDRRPDAAQILAPLPPSPTTRSRPTSAISFGDFTSITSVMDAALAREEDRRRKGMEEIDAENEVITFGDVRLVRVRRASRANNEDPPSSTISRLGPRRITALPQVVEAVETNRPSTPLSPAALPSAAPLNLPPVTFGVRRLPNGIVPTPADIETMAQSLSSMRMSHHPA